MNRIKKNDQVIVIAGRDKGRKGTVTRVDGERIWVENVNVVKRHQKPNPAKGLQGGIVEKEMSLHVSNVALFNPVTSKADRVGFRTLEDGRKVRYFKSNNEVVDA
ncbi:MAG: 50S ribosomal protein L24 [Gammaproteobacteria bacterium]|nr:50S ribosomal protein L24 [Gammaproteobacteria bacterium]